MAMRTVVCPECETPVPYGRLSCPACGSLLASVAGAPRRAAALRDVPVEEPPMLLDDADDAAAPGDLDDAAEPAPAGEREDPPIDDTRETDEPIQDAPAADEVVPASAPADIDDASEPAPPEVELPADTTAPETTTADEAAPRWPSPAEDPAPRWAPPPLPAAPPPLPATPAGSWLPPSAAFGPAAPSSGAAIAIPTGVPDAARLRPGRASLLSDLPFDAPDDLAGWLVALGSAVVTAGFLLPWSTRIPFSTGDGYFGQWGLATPSHLPVLLATLIVLSLAILPNRLPPWLRSGAVPLALGGLLLGLVWPYAIGSFGSGVGSLAVAAGSIVLVIAGLIAVRPVRRTGGRPPG